MDGQAFAVIASGVILFALVSKKLDGSIVTAPMAFTGFGLLITDAARIDFGQLRRVQRVFSKLWARDRYLSASGGQFYGRSFDPPA